MKNFFSEKKKIRCQVHFKEPEHRENKLYMNGERLVHIRAQYVGMAP